MNNHIPYALFEVVPKDGIGRTDRFLASELFPETRTIFVLYSVSWLKIKRFRLGCKECF